MARAKTTKGRILSIIICLISSVATYGQSVQSAQQIRFFNPGNDTGGVFIKAPVAPVRYTLTLPPGAGSSGQMLTTDGTGLLQWSTPEAGWTLLGNANTDPATNFLGTTDNVDLVIRSFNIERMRVRANGVISTAGDLYSLGNLGAGTAPTERLTVSGNAYLNADDAGLLVDVSGSSRFGIIKKQGATPVLAAGSGSVISLGHWSTANILGNITSGSFTPRLSINTSGLVTINSLDGTARSSVPTGFNRFVIADSTGQLEEASFGSVLSSLNGLTGTGTQNYLPKFTSSSTLGNSSVYDDGTNVGIGTAIPSQKFEISGGNLYLNSGSSASELRFREPSASGSNYTAFKAGAQAADITYTLPLTAPSSGQVLTSDATGSLSWASTSATSWSLTGNTLTDSTTQFLGSTNAFPIVLRSNNTERLRVTSNGNVGIGDASPASLFTVGNGDLFQVNSAGAIAAVTGITSTGGYTQKNAANATVASISADGQTLAIGGGYTNGVPGTYATITTVAGTNPQRGIWIQPAVGGAISGGLVLKSGADNGTDQGPGAILIQVPDRTSGNGSFTVGNITIQGGSAVGGVAHNASDINVLTGTGGGTGRGGNISLTAGTGGSAAGTGGTVSISAGAQGAGGANGSVSVTGRTVIQPRAAAETVLTLTGVASQSGSLLNLQNSSAVSQFSVGPSGATTVGGTLTLSSTASAAAADSVLMINSSNQVTKTTRAALLAASGWALTGNANTNASTNFIGTTDAVDFVLRSNNTERMRVLSSGNIGIGTSTPAKTLDVSGNIQVRKAEASGQESLLRVLSTQSTGAADVNWRGRAVYGAENLTTIMGVYRNQATIGAHSWTSANSETGAGWADLYLNWDPSAGGGGANVYTKGSFGVGTTSPTNLLDVAGTFRATGASTIGGTLTLSNTASAAAADSVLMINSSNQVTKSTRAALFAGSGWALVGNAGTTNGGTLGSAPTGNFVGTTGTAASARDLAFVTQNLIRMQIDTGGTVRTEKDLVVNGVTVGRGSPNASSVNTALGAGALAQSTGLAFNTAVGNSALSVTTGANNTAVGYNSMGATTTGGSNTAVGSGSLGLNTVGTQNAALGVAALGANTSGTLNSAFGMQSLQSNTTGVSNSAVGGYSFLSLNSGSRNTAVGAWAGRYTSAGANLTTASRTVFLGDSTRINASGDTNEIVIGSGAVGIGSNSVVLGGSDITATRLQGNVGIGANPTLAAGDAQLQVTSSAAANRGLVVKGAASQTANLLELQNSAGTAQLSVGPSGATTIGGTLTLSSTASAAAADSVLMINSSNQVTKTTKAALFAGSGWALVGNSGTNPSSSYLGTSDSVDLVVRTNATERLRIAADGRIGLGTAPSLASTDAQVQIQSMGSTRPGLRVKSVAGATGLIVQGAASQTANLQEWKNSAGTNVATMSAGGNMTLGTFNAAGISKIDYYGNGSGMEALEFTNSANGSAVETGLTMRPGQYLHYISSIRTLTNSINGAANNVLQFMVTTDIGPSITPSKSYLREVLRLTTTNGALFTNQTAAAVAVTVKGAASQTANLLELQNSAGTAQLSVGPSGATTVGGTLTLSSTASAAAADSVLMINSSNQVTKTTRAALLAASGWALSGNAGTNASTNFIGTTDATDFVARTSNTERMRIKSDGFVGIATTAPMRDLHVVGGTAIGANYGNYWWVPAVGDKVLQLSSSTSPTTGTGTVITLGGRFNTASPDQTTWGSIGGFKENAVNADGDGYLGFFTNKESVGGATERMRISSAGAVGIGTTAPSTLLDVAGTFRATGAATIGGTLTLSSTASAAAADSVLMINSSNQVTKTTRAAFLAGGGWALAGNSLSDSTTQFLGSTNAFPLVMRTNNVERMRIMSTGRVGIGTNNPQGTLDVTLGNSDVNYNMGEQAIIIRNSTTTANARMGLRFTSGTNSSGLAQIDLLNGATTNEGILSFGTRNSAGTIAERMRITSSGEVGIGTTNPTARFHVAGGNVLIDTTSAGTAGQLQLRNPAGTFQTNIRAGAQTSSITYTLPTTAPTEGQVLSSDASGNMSWSTALTSSSGWSLLGNAGTSAATNFLGTTDAVDVVLRRNNVERARVTSTGLRVVQNGAPRSTQWVGSFQNLGGPTYIELLNSDSATDGGGMYVGMRGTGQVGDTATIWNWQGGPMAFYTGPTNKAALIRMFINNNGNVAIGSHLPTARLHTRGGHVLIDTIGGSGGTTPGQLQLRNPQGTAQTNLQAGYQTSDITLTLPAALPTTNGQVLTANTTGAMQWTDLTSTSWSVTGNAGTNPSTNFLGTTDANDLVLRRDNTERARLTNAGLRVVQNGTPRTSVWTLSVQNIQSTGTSSSTVVEFLNSTAAIDGGGAFVGLKGTGNIGDSLGIWNHQAGPIVLQTGLTNRSSVVRMYVDPDGDVAIGNRIPTERLHVQGGNLLIDTIGSSGTAGQLQFRNPAGTFKTNFRAGAQSANITYTLPVTAPTAGQVLSSDASGNMSWATPSASVALSSISAATATNTIDNLGFAQTWQWNSLSTNAGMTFSSNSTAAGSNLQTLVNVALSGANATASQTTYGLQVSNTHTGTSSTNVGMSVSASGGTNNYALVVPAGNVGVNTTAPNTSLDVDGGVSVRPGTVSVTADNQAITVGNRSFIRLTSNSTPTNRTITLSNGLQDGQLLFIRVDGSGTAGNGVEIADSGSCNLSGIAQLIDSSVIQLIWDGSASKWFEVTRSLN